MAENRIYNEPQKERYLKFVSDNEGTQTTIRSLFHKSWIFEDSRDRDLCNFNLEELGKVIEQSNPFNKNVAKSTARFLSSYISWAIENGLRQNNINPLDGVNTKWIENFVDMTKKIHYSNSEFLEILTRIPNYQDKAFLFCLYEGISGERFSEIKALERSDINQYNNTIYIGERDVNLPVSPECIECVIKAHDETVYEQYNMKTKQFSKKELLSSYLIFKNAKSPRSQEENQEIGMNVLYSRLHAMRDYLQLEFLTPNALRQSGMIKMAVDIYQEEGKLAYEQLAKIGEKYDYSTIINQGTGEPYYNTHLMREFLNSENLLELYGLNIEVEKR